MKDLLRLDRSVDGAAALQTMRIRRFEPVDRSALASARRAFDRAAGAGG